MYCLHLEGDRSGSGGCWINLEEGKCPLYYFRLNSVTNEDGGSTFPQKVYNICCENPKNHHHLNNAAKTWKPTLRTRVSHSFILCNVSSVEWLFGTDFMYCCLHSATNHILEDTSHHIQVILCCWVPSLEELHCHYLLFHQQLVPPSL